MLITKHNWSAFAKKVADPSDPLEYCEAAMGRLTDIMDKHIVRVRGVKPQFRACNKVQVIDFSTREGLQFYNEAMDRFRKRKAKAEQRASEDPSYSPRTEMLVALLMFRIAAESNPDRVKYKVEAMYDSVKNHNMAAVSADNFRISICKEIKMLMDPPFNVKRNEISVIWGGAKINQSAKKKTKKAILGNEDLLEALEKEGINLEDIGMGEDVELFDEVKFDDNLRLNTQNRQQRQEEIDRFQRGESKYCFFTFKAGGVGLSLHHTDEFVTPKCRRKPSGYVIEEDIPNVPTRQRILFCSPTYSAIELVQGLGRCPRLTSLSSTPQLLIFFRGTIEQRVAAICEMKLRSMSSCIRMREDWNDIVTGNEEEAYNQHAIENKTTDEDDDSGLLGNIESEDE